MFGFGNKLVGLALSGGAARGFAHIGVIKVLQSNGIPIHFVAGTSAGSIIGALLCADYGWQEMLRISDELKWHKLVAPTLSGMGLVKADRLEEFIGKLLGEMTFEELSIPFRAVAVDIACGEEIVFKSGSVARAVRASSSVPGIFEPVLEDDTALVDGGVTNNLPCDVVRAMGANKVIAVDLNAQRPLTSVPTNLLDVTYRSFSRMLDMTSADGREDADILIQPDLQGIGYHDLSKVDDLVERGERAALDVLKKLKRLR